MKRNFDRSLRDKIFADRICGHNLNLIREIFENSIRNPTQLVPLSQPLSQLYPKIPNKIKKYPVSRAILQNPSLLIRFKSVLPGFESKTSSAPPITIPASAPPFGLFKTKRRLFAEDSTPP